MSLKHVHIIFIVAAIVISMWFGIWAVNYYRDEKDRLYFILAVLSFGSLLGLTVYLRYFLKKYKSKLS